MRLRVDREPIPNWAKFLAWLCFLGAAYAGCEFDRAWKASFERDRVAAEKTRAENEARRAAAREEEAATKAAAEERRVAREKAAAERLAAMPIAERLKQVRICDQTEIGLCTCRKLIDSTPETDRLRPEYAQMLATQKQRLAALAAADQAEQAKTRGLLCRDGSSSPSCTCAAPKRGCCSRHGGVASCEPFRPYEAPRRTK